MDKEKIESMCAALRGIESKAQDMYCDAREVGLTSTCTLLRGVINACGQAVGEVKAEYRLRVREMERQEKAQAATESAKSA